MSATTELQTWLNGTPTGGPNGDGRYPLTAKDGQTYLVYCPAAQALNPTLAELPVELFTQEAAGSAAAANTAATAAESARVAAAASASNAANSATSATTSANLAAGYAEDSADYVVAASGSASAANTARTAAETARNLAQDWASKAENSVVVSGQYSALHWAAKAAASAASVSLGNYWTKTEADGRFLQGSMVDISAAADNSLPVGAHVSSTNGATGGFLGWTAVTFKRSTLREARLQFSNSGGTEVPQMWVQTHHDSVGGGGWTNAYEIWHSGNITPAVQADTLTHRSLIPNAANLNSYNATGIHHQNSNAQAATGTNYPVALAGVLFVYAASVMIYQTYQRYDNGQRWHRSCYNGTWSAWREEWSSVNFDPATKANLASPSFTGTVNSAGQITMANGAPINFSTGTTQQMLNLWGGPGAPYGIGVQNNTTYFRTGGGFAWHKNGAHTATEADPGAGGVCQAILDSAGNFRAAGELQSVSANSFRQVFGNYGLIHRNDGASYYWLVTASGQQFGAWNSLRPMTMDLVNGNVTFGHNVVVSGVVEARTRLSSFSHIAVGTQAVIQDYGWNNLVPRWKSVIEADATLSWYSYDTAGGAPVRAIQLGRASVSCHLPLSVSGGVSTAGPITATGASAALYSNDRTTGRTWAWYGRNDAFALYNGAGDIVTIDTSGNVYANAFYPNGAGGALLRGNGTSLETSNGPLYQAQRGYTLSANGAAWVGNARTFVQSGDPGAQAADGDLWIW